LWSIIFCLVCLSASFAWSGYRYREQAEAATLRQEKFFRDLYPAERLPLAVKARLESDLERLRGLSGVGDESDNRPSALVGLYELFRRMPTDLRYRLLDIRIDPEGVVLEGQVRTHGDADIMASALRKQNGFAVEPPRTEQLPQNVVGFVLSAKRRTEADSPKGPIVQQPATRSAAKGGK
jgi:hypothetical protein